MHRSVSLYILPERALVQPVVEVLFSILGGMGLVLLGARFLSSAFQNLADPIIRRCLNSVGKSSLVSLTAGMFVSFFVQSRSSTSLMAMSYAQSGLLNLRQMIVFLLGSSLGMVLTPWLFGIPLGRVDLYLIGLGVLPMLYARWSLLSHFGKFVLSLGLLFLGFRLLVEGLATGGLSALHWLPDFSTGQGGLWFWVVLAALLVNVFRSSLAVIAALMAFVASGELPAIVGVAGILGVNLGSTLPTLFLGWRGRTLVRQGTFAYFLSYAVGVFVVGILFTPFVMGNQWLVSSLFQALGGTAEPYSLWLLPATHLTLNFLVAVVFLILVPLLEFVATKVIPEGPQKEVQNLHVFGRAGQMAPSLALDLAHQEIKKMAAMVESVLFLTSRLVNSNQLNREDVEKILKYEGVTDNVQIELREFLTRITEVSLTTKQGLQIKSIMRIADELENIADNCKAIFHSYKLLAHRKESHVAHLMHGLDEFFSEIVTFYENVFSCLTGTEEDLEQDVQLTAKMFQQRVVHMKMNYFQTLSKIQERPEEAEVAVSVGEILVYLIQIRSHTKNIYDAIY